MIYCSETLVSDMSHVSELLVPSFPSPELLVPLSCCVWARYLGNVGWLHTYEMVSEHFANPNLSVVVAKCWFLGFVV